MNQDVPDSKGDSEGYMTASMSLFNLGLRARDVPAQAEVYKQVRKRWKRLGHMRQLLRHESETVLPCTLDYLADLQDRWAAENPSITFRIDVHIMSRAVWSMECNKARGFLLDTLKLQQQTLDKPHMLQLFRSAVEKQSGIDNEALTDMERLYMALTDPDEDDVEDEWDAEDHLETTFALVLHYNYAEIHKTTLDKLRNVASRVLNRCLSPSQRIMQRVIQKTRSVKIDAFACPITLDAVRELPPEEQSCPICQHGYLDTQNFSMEDLVADFPYRIKYCGHIIGKSCLETWIGTPLIDPARYPYHTCPICRIPLEKRASPIMPDNLHIHVFKNEMAKKVKKAGEFRAKDCLGGILRCVNMEFVFAELGVEVQRQRSGQKMDEQKENECKAVLKEGMERLQEEKKIWGFSDDVMVTMWRKMAQEWLRSGARM